MKVYKNWPWISYRPMSIPFTCEEWWIHKTSESVHWESSQDATNTPAFYVCYCRDRLHCDLFDWASFIWENRPLGTKNCFVTAVRYRKTLQGVFFPEFQQRGCFATRIFSQDAVLAPIERGVKKLLRHHFTEHRIISRGFHTRWSPYLLRLTPYVF